MFKRDVIFNFLDRFAGCIDELNAHFIIYTLVKIDFTLKTLKKHITALGKVKWIKVIVKDIYYEAGVEFVNTPGEAIKKIEDYISFKQKDASLKPFWIFTKFNEPESK